MSHAGDGDVRAHGQCKKTFFHVDHHGNMFIQIVHFHEQEDSAILKRNKDSEVPVRSYNVSKQFANTLHLT